MGADARLLIVGGGFSGLVAAVDAQTRGIETVLCEASRTLGGAARYSRGTVWTMDPEHLAENTAGRRELQSLVVHETARGREWLECHGVRFVAPVDVGYGRGRRFDVDAALEVLAARFAEAGGSIRLSTRIVAVDPDASGLLARTAEGKELRAGKVLLASGGFASSRALCDEFGVPWEAAAPRAHAHARGDGLRIARAAGAGTSGDDMDSFYGHAMAEVVPAPDPAEWFAVSQIYGHLVTAISFGGRRIVPRGREWFVSDDELNAEIAHRHGGRAVYLVDANDMATEVRPGTLTVGEVLRQLDDRLSTAFPARDPAALEAGLLALGVTPPAGAREREELLGGLRYPVRAVPVRAGRTLTGGGVLVDERMRVLDATLHTPVWHGRLLSAGADVGGINSGVYLGGLSTALVTARRAVAEVAASG